MKNLTGESMNITKENLKAMQQLFPEAFEEGKIDFDVLRQLLGDFVDDEQERYSFKWNGKGKALRLSQTPSMGTLRPCKEESKDWDNTQNLYIEGDNLEVLKLLQKSYYGKVKMIYIDPPYNTGGDFVYKDNFHDNIQNYKDITRQTDGDGNWYHANKENRDSNGRFHTDWLNMMYPRLRLARNLLTDDGVIFISIDDNEQENLKRICDEIFGSDNFIALFPRITKKSGKTTDNIAKNHDYILGYSKSDSPLIYLQEHDDEGFRFEDDYVNERGKYKLNQTLDYDSLSYSPSLDYPIEIDGMTFYPGQSYEKYMERKSGKYARADWAWRWSKDLFDYGYNNGFVVIKRMNDHARLYTKTYQNAKILKDGNTFKIEKITRTKTISSIDFIDNEFSNDNSKKGLLKVFDTSVFDYSKPVSMLEKLALYLLRNDDIVLDFFSGSATTGQAIMQLNSEDGDHRKFIMVQIPEPTDEKSEAYKAGYKNICEIGKERIRRAGDKIKAEAGDKAADLDIGFKVFKLDSSNLQKWNPQPDDLVMTLQQATDNFLSDRTEQDVLYEIMLKMGLDLTCQIEEEQAAGETVYIIGGGALMICLGRNITTAVAEAVVKLHEEYESELWQVVFRDTGFASDMDKTNVKETLKAAGLDEDSFVCV